MCKIPKKIHQVWIGNKQIPSKFESFANDIKNIHEELGYEYKLWNNDCLEKYEDDIFISNYLKKQSRVPWAFICDRIRLLILRDEGGIYLDIDCELIKNFNNILEKLSDNISFFCGVRSHFSALYAKILFEPAVMGAVENSRILNLILNSYKKNILHNATLHSKIILENIEPDIAIFNYKRFYDSYASEEAIVLHDPHHLGSWFSEPNQNWGGQARRKLN